MSQMSQISAMAETREDESHERDGWVELLGRDREDDRNRQDE